jgi:hypothetical protein
MAIKSSTFGRTELSGKDAERFMMCKIYPVLKLRPIATRGRYRLAQ